MSVANTFEDFLANQAPQVDMGQFVVNIGTAGALAALMALLYARFGRGQAHRSLFAGNFFLLTMTTMLVISVVKSSLALSLGLVGALSVIRFRTAIKDPEELSFLFLSIAVGLGLGADQRTVTVAGLVCILVVYALLKIRGGSVSRPGALYLHLSQIGETPVSELLNALTPHTQRVKLKRWSTGEAVFLVEVKELSALEAVKSACRQKAPQSQLTVTEYQELA